LLTYKKRAMRIAFDIREWMQCEIDRDTMATDRSFVRTHLSDLDPRFSPAPLLVAICVVQWSALVLTALQSPAFALSAAPLRQWDSASRYEWILPKPRVHPLRAGSAAGPLPHAHPIPGVPGIPPRALPEPAHISSNKVKRSRAWPLRADQPVIRPYQHLRRLSSGTYIQKRYFEIVQNHSHNIIKRSYYEWM